MFEVLQGLMYRDRLTPGDLMIINRFKQYDMKKHFIFPAIALIGCAASLSAESYRQPDQIRPPRIAMVVKAPGCKSVHGRMPICERREMAVAYLRNHKTLTAKKYARMTGLSKKEAGKELDAFALDREVPIAAAMDGKGKVYVYHGCRP